MTTEDLDERLRSHGDAWRARDVDAPSLDAMLDVATGRRMRWQPWLAVAAGVLVVAAVAAIPIARHAQHDSHDAAASPTPSATPPPTTPPPTIVINGKTLTRFGTERWSAPVLDEHDPAVVWIYARIQGGPACFFAPVAFVQSETVNAATVVVGEYVAPHGLPSGVLCASVALGPERVKVTLRAPLGSRQLIDATTGKPRDVLDPATFPAPQFVPLGYEAAPVGWDGADGYDAAGSNGVALRAYRHGQNDSLEIKMGPPAALGHVGPVILDRPTVRGHPATVWRDTSKNVTCLTWSESATVAFQVCDRRYPKPVLDAATLVQVANSLH